MQTSTSTRKDFLVDLPNSDARTGPSVDRGNPTILPFPPPPAPTIDSQLPHLAPHPHELVASSSHSNAVLPVRNNEPDDLSPEPMLRDLTRYITKDEDYPVTRGRSKIVANVRCRSTWFSKEKKTKRIERELRICASLKHANILPVYGYTSGFGPFIAIVSPWAEKGNLTVYLEREGETLTLVRRFQILTDIIAGLQYLHANSVIHGDFTGPNVLIRGDGTACVADFGLSLMYSEFISASQASWTSTLKGNMRWIAPDLLVEQEDGSPARPSEQSDIYSFGGIMLQVLTNKVPYYHLTNDAAIILCIAKSEKPSRSRYPVLPDKYWHLIEQCWSADPQDRPSTERSVYGSRQHAVLLYSKRRLGRLDGSGRRAHPAKQDLELHPHVKFKLEILEMCHQTAAKRGYLLVNHDANAVIFAQ
ncbi:kinase-like domain-containing protein [Suillus ampliporus]|nr:kinase-like domain-containing protein [Suillus ampliporus]